MVRFLLSGRGVGQLRRAGIVAGLIALLAIYGLRRETAEDGIPPTPSPGVVARRRP